MYIDISTGKSLGKEWDGRPVEDYLLYHGLNPDKVTEKSANSIIEYNKWTIKNATLDALKRDIKSNRL